MTKHTMVHEQMQFFFHGFRRDARPMSVLVGSVGALSLFYHDSLDINDPHLRDGTYPRLDRSVEQVISDPKQKIGRPRQVFVGSPKRDVPAKR